MYPENAGAYFQGIFVAFDIPVKTHKNLIAASCGKSKQGIDPLTTKAH